MGLSGTILESLGSFLLFSELDLDDLSIGINLLFRCNSIGQRVSTVRSFEFFSLEKPFGNVSLVIKDVLVVALFTGRLTSIERVGIFVSSVDIG